MVVRADLTYSQGIHRMWSRKTRFDFYWPAFAHLAILSMTLLIAKDLIIISVRIRINLFIKYSLLAKMSKRRPIEIKNYIYFYPYWFCSYYRKCSP
jgi:hypothetical protein